MADIFLWAWDCRKQGTPPDEPIFSMAEIRAILEKEADEIVSEKRIRQCEEDGIVTPARTQGGHRKFSVTDVLCIYLCIKGCAHLSSEGAFLLVTLYRMSRKQPTKHDPTIFDYDPSALEKGHIGNFINNPMVRRQFSDIKKLSKLIRRIDDFLEINRFAKEHGIAFKCDKDELLIVERAGIKIKIAPPLTEWRSVKMALHLKQFYIAKAKVENRFPSTKEEFQAFNKKINESILNKLLEQNDGVVVNKGGGGE